MNYCLRDYKPVNVTYNMDTLTFLNLGAYIIHTVNW